MLRASSMLTATPLPWLPSCGLTTTGQPISQAAAQASSASVDRPADRHRHAGRAQQLLGQFLVLRDRFGDGAGAVRLGGLDAALACCPSRTAPGCPRSGAGRECRARRRPGRWRRCWARGAHPRRARAGAPARPPTSKGASSARRGRASRPVRGRAGRPPPRCIRRPPDRRRARPVAAVRLKVTGQPAWACRPSAASSSTCAMDIAPSWVAGSRNPISGNRARRRASTAGHRGDGCARLRRRPRWPRWRCAGSTDWGRAGADRGDFHADFLVERSAPLAVGDSAAAAVGARGPRAVRVEGFDAGRDQHRARGRGPRRRPRPQARLPPAVSAAVAPA